VSPVRYELGVYIPEDDILHSQSHVDLKCYILSWMLSGAAIFFKQVFWKLDLHSSLNVGYEGFLLC
jgi:hypothetical protein